MSNKELTTGTATEARVWNGQLTDVPDDVGAKLRGAVRSNPTFEAMCHIFDVRERTRRTLNVRSIATSLRHEGHSVSRADVVRCLRLLEAIGIGKILLTEQGQVDALTHIKYTLSAVSKAALSKQPAAPAPELLQFENLTRSQLTRRPDSPVLSPDAPLLNAKPAPATTLAAPTLNRASEPLDRKSASGIVRSITNAQPKPADGMAVVIVKINGKEVTFEMTAEEARKLVSQLL